MSRIDTGCAASDQPSVTGFAVACEDVQAALLLRAAFSADSRVREDSDSRLWIESHDSVRWQHYVAVTDGAAACAGLLEIRTPQSNADDTIAGIVGSIGIATAWPAEVK